ncbi:MAG: hypothetical protein IJQ73_14590 [Kiritimatiellae bacterium]|nr:hypothetical protein [Kiritimatiellia bacterium]
MSGAKKVLLGVTGSIAAYKAAELVRLLVRGGSEVQVVMTDAACQFVTPLTFQTLSRNPVHVGTFDPPAQWQPGHVSLAQWADLVLVAPASANTIAKMRFGLADNLLSSLLLATRSQIAVAPAMNDGMWTNPATQENIAVLRSRGVLVISPHEGALACGSVGPGRMAEPSDIYKELFR